MIAIMEFHKNKLARLLRAKEICQKQSQDTKLGAVMLEFGPDIKDQILTFSVDVVIDSLNREIDSLNREINLKKDAAYL